MAKKKGGKKDDKKASEPAGESSDRQTSEKETLLQKELDELTANSTDLRSKLDDLRKQNRFLEDEAHKSISETADYALYMKREAENRSNQIISVNQMNKHEIEMIGRECGELNERFSHRLEELKDDLEEKRKRLRGAEEELEGLEYIKLKEKDALSKIKQLETALEQTRTKHSTEIQQMKADFLNEKKSLSNQAESEILKLSKKATEVATTCLNQHAERIQIENQKLRTELLGLLSESDGLQERKQELEQQYLSFLRENEYLDDLQKMRIHWSAQAFEVVKSKNIAVKSAKRVALFIEKFVAFTEKFIFLSKNRILYHRSI